MTPDLQLSISGVGFLLFLLPAIRDSMRGRTSITLVTSAPTALFLCNTGAALFRLDQPIVAYITIMSAACWAVLVFRRWRENTWE